MKKFRVSQTVTYSKVIEAETQQEAEERFADIEPMDLEVLGVTGDIFSEPLEEGEREGA